MTVRSPAVYQIVTIGSNGSQQRHLPVYANRAAAVEAAKACEDKDPKYNRYGGRWKVKIERLPVEEVA